VISSSPTKNCKWKKVEYAVAFASQQLDESQEKSHTTDKEALAIYDALKTFYHYLYGTKFTVETDNQALKGFFKKPENMSRKVIRYGHCLKMDLTF
jgi:hypothetical protein